VDYRCGSGLREGGGHCLGIAQVSAMKAGTLWTGRAGQNLNLGTCRKPLSRDLPTQKPAAAGDQDAPTGEWSGNLAVQNFCLTRHAAKGSPSAAAAPA
jgi:hypothetical protein